jgi:hypothetical protein
MSSLSSTRWCLRTDGIWPPVAEGGLYAARNSACPFMVYSSVSRGGPEGTFMMAAGHWRPWSISPRDKRIIARLP